MSDKPKLTFGAAIDSVASALDQFDPKSRRAILDAVCSHLEVDPSSPLSRLGWGAGRHEQESTADQIEDQNGEHSAPAHKIDQTDIRQLRTTKKPSSARQMACLVAFYLQEHAPAAEKKETVTAADLEKYFKQAGFPLPEKIQQVLPDAKIGGYFDTTSTRGVYKLTRVGYNLVVQKLPRSAAG